VKITTAEMEIALSRYLDYRQNLIVPNVHWGMNMHECDLLMVSKAGYCTEIEIKISRADLKNDGKKKHGHYCPKIKYLYFAIPTFLDHCLELVPERAGIILVDPENDNYWTKCKRVREPVATKGAPKMSDIDQYKVARLGALRIWNLKSKIIKAGENAK